MKSFTYASVLLCCLLVGCAAQKPPKPEWKIWPSNGAPYLTCRAPWILVNTDHCELIAPAMPKGAACGEPVKFDNGETWIYPCWPEKAEPKRVSGATSAAKDGEK